MTRADFVRAGRWTAVLMAGASLTACATPEYSVRQGLGAGPVARGPTQRPPSNGKTGTMAPYEVGGIWYVPREQPNYDETGVASWYGEAFNLKATADGEVFDLNQFSAAHTTLPLPSMVEVTNLDNGRKLVVRVNDRGPFVGGRIIDLSQAAARELGYERAGIAHVRVRYVGPAPLAGPDAGVRYAKATPGPGAPAFSASRAPAAIPVSAPVRGRRPADEEIFAEAGSVPAAVAQSALKPLEAAPSAAYGASRAPAAIQVSARMSDRRPADEEIFADAGSVPGGGADVALKPLVAPPAPVSVASLSPLADARPARSSLTASEPQASSSMSPAGLFRIQAGAFGDEENARRAAAQLSAFGTADIEPIQRGGVTLYRVTLPGPADEAEAYGVRDRVAAAGFSDARVLRPAAPLQ